MTSHTFSTPRRLRLGGTALLAAAVMALSGCNSAGEPETAATASSLPAESTSPSATPTPTATYKPADATGRAQNVPIPVLPEVATTETKEGLEAFAKYWFELLSYGYETGDVSQISAITSPKCVMCGRAQEVQTGWHQDGRWLVGGRVTTPAASTNFQAAGDGNFQVAIQVSQEALSYFNADGTLDSTDPKPADSGSLMFAVYREGSWFVNTIEPIAG